jgi:hypothetical protein
VHLSPGQLPLPLDNIDPAGFVRPGRKSKYARVLGYIYQHPNTWVCIDTRKTLWSATQLAADIRRGRRAQLRGLDAIVRYGYQVWCRLPEADTHGVDES